MPTTSSLAANYLQAFKEADIRGVYPKEIDEEVAYLIARAFVEEFSYKQVVVGRDMRLSSPQLRDSFVRGVIDAGARVVDIGLVTTPMLYFASATMKLPGVMITASHSPKDQNGLKLVSTGAVPLTEKTGLRAIRNRLTKGTFLPDAARPGTVVEKDIIAAFARYVLKGNKIPKGAAQVRVVVDCGNGMGTLLLPILRDLGLDVTPLFVELDGAFPHRGSNPTVPKNQKAIAAALKAGEFDFGIAFDGDADRVAFFDERGQFINCGAIGALIAETLLPKNPKAVFVGTVLTSRAFREAVITHGGRYKEARVGHSYVKEVMHKNDAVFGCEHSGHFFFKDFFHTDTVELTIRSVLHAYRTAGVAFSALVSPYTQYYQTEDLMVAVSDEKTALAGMVAQAQKEAGARMVLRDGLTLNYGDAWVVIKPSVTETALNIIAEGTNKKRVITLRDAAVAQARLLA
ncbi:phosphomannomutase/phosphoglucomutase [Patescibacteria group bacterium]|nr:phosphomannomutase/phosphoglucomutase [Patescibacteria group bacterium]